MFDHLESWVAALAVSGGGIGFGLWIFGKVAPGLVLQQLERAFLSLRDSGFIQHPGKPKRLAAYKAILEWLEDEIPEPGEDVDFYGWLGEWVASHVKVFSGSAKAWSKALMNIGDKVDPALDEEIKRLGGTPTVHEAKKPGV